MDREAVASIFLGHLALDHGERLQLGYELNSLEQTMTDQERELVREVRRRHDIFYRDAFREGISTTREEGRTEGEAQMLLRILGRRLGKASSQQERIIKGLSIANAELLGDSIFSFETSEDLDQWLKKHGFLQ